MLFRSADRKPSGNAHRVTKAAMQSGQEGDGGGPFAGGHHETFHPAVDAGTGEQAGASNVPPHRTRSTVPTVVTPLYSMQCGAGVSGPPEELSSPPDAGACGPSIGMPDGDTVPRSAGRRPTGAGGARSTRFPEGWLRQTHTRATAMASTGSRERPAAACVLVLPPSYRITAAGLLGWTPLVDGQNAAKGSRQTGCVPSEDAVAPEARDRKSTRLNSSHR